MADPIAETRIIGRYALHVEIASGGMATVHLGRLLGPVGFSRTVAIKRLHPQYAKDPEFVSMFLDEARLAARIRHPNVVPTLDVVATAGELFLVMDYVQGESLSRLARASLAARAAIPKEIVASILSGVLHGLHAAHDAKNERGEPLGIVHRDVSPQNVLVGTDGVARVLDFGVAKAAGRLQTTREGQIKGKLAYMPPEQLTGGAVTRQSDIYAAAVVLWEALTNQRLFAGANEGAVLAKVLHDRVAPPSTIVPGLSRAFDDVVMRGLSRNPSKRFATAREMALALEQCSALAPPSVVGDWVERIAGAELTQRADRILELESSSSLELPSGTFASRTGEPQTAQDWLETMGASSDAGPMVPISISPDVTQSSQVSSISVATPEGVIANERRKLRNRVVVAGGMLLMTAMVIIGLSSRRLAPAPAPAAVAPPVVASPSVAVPAVSLPTAPAPTVTVQEDSPPSSASSRAVSPTKPARPVATPRAPSHSSCDPPYTLEADGQKHYKLECL